MIDIVGGTYREKCSIPYWSQLYGSGGRAAAAIAQLESAVMLHTYIGAADCLLLDLNAQMLGFATTTVQTQQTIGFEYFHGLSIPIITPLPVAIGLVDPITVTAENILRFGILEGTGLVHGQWVVYDPQNPRRPEAFYDNGSSAEHLAIVANYGEAAALSGHTEITSIGQTLLQRGAEVVVIKRGALGATVITANRTETIPAFVTEAVFPIGSGDVFAAVFAYFWSVERRDPFAAARSASVATAYYCSTRTLPVASTVFEANPFVPAPVALSERYELAHLPRVYLASPFFTIAQRWLVEEARTALQDHQLSVFSPFHDVGLGPAEKVVQPDLDGLNQCDLVFAIVDGGDIGTVYEIGYARSRDIPVIALAENMLPESLKMLEGTDCTICCDFVSAVYNTVWKAFAI